MSCQLRSQYLISLALFQIAASAADLNVNLTTNPPSPRPVGTSITLTATVSGDPDPSPNYLYSFSIAGPGGPMQLRRASAPANSWTWTPSALEGTFTISATVRNVHAGTSGTRTMPFTLTSRLVSGLAAVNTTNNPLVAFFSGPACQMPNQMRVRFTPTSVPQGGINRSMTTAPLPCRYDLTSSSPNAASMNFYVAGMYPNRVYNMHWEVLNPAGTVIRNGADFQFTTGSIPANLTLPTFTPTGTPGNVAPIVVHHPITIPVNGRIFTPVASDTAGNVLWYTNNGALPISFQKGGNFWGAVGGVVATIIREVDLAGNTVIETSVGAINEQLVAMGKSKIFSLHHEVRRIYAPTPGPPNGYIMVLGSNERVSTSAQGGTPQNPVLVLGDIILVLDQNMKVVWTWDTFDFLDINQKAILDEKCMQPGGGGCPSFDPAFQVANDWTHANSLQYTPYDGNIIMSMRHLDTVLKVNYGNGAGDGHVVWKMGNGPAKGIGGTPLPTVQIFTNNTRGQHDIGYPSFSHQHDAEIELGGAKVGGARILTLFDNGNVRQLNFNPNAQSRCQLFAINEDALTANLNRNVDLGTYSFAVGSAQLLSNGNTVCDSGFIGGFPAAGTNPRTETTESDATGNVFHRLSLNQDSYRTWRMVDLYTPVNP